MTGQVDVAPHEHADGTGHVLQLAPLEVPCASIALSPAEHPPGGDEGDVSLDGRRRWRARDGALLDLGSDAERVAQLRLVDQPQLDELTRAASRCRVALDVPQATLLGWIDCAELTALAGPVAHQKPPRALWVPRVKMGSSVSIRCIRPMPLEALRGDLRVRIGTIASGTSVSVWEEEAADAYRLSPPRRTAQR